MKLTLSTVHDEEKEEEGCARDGESDSSMTHRIRHLAARYTVFDRARDSPRVVSEQALGYQDVAYLTTPSCTSSIAVSNSYAACKTLTLYWA